jgi:hypothetical protein
LQPKWLQFYGDEAKEIRSPKSDSRLQNYGLTAKNAEIAKQCLILLLSLRSLRSLRLIMQLPPESGPLFGAVAA